MRLYRCAFLLLPMTLACGDVTELELDIARIGTDNSRIVGGSTYSGMPAVGALTYNGGASCTGTLIEPRKVLTAAHCVSGKSAAYMRFVIGPSVSSAQAVIRVKSLIPHPNYSSYNTTHDIGLVILASDASVKPMQVLTTPMTSSWVGRSLYFVGYGVSNGYYGSGSGTKRAVWMKVSRVSSYTFTYNDSGRNTCNGDSGGPAFYQDASGNYLVAGVTSYGDQNCTQYGVDTRVDRYLSFVKPSTPAPPPTDPCQGETYAGRCSGTKVVWCEDSKVHTQDCADKSMVCTYDATQKYYACAKPAASTDPCQGETYAGRCSGASVIWCENKQVYQVDCKTKYGKGCGWSSPKNYYGCM